MIGKNKYLNILMFADDLAIIQNNENELQRSVYILNQLGKQYYNMKISLKKTKVMAHHGKFPVRSKIIIENNPIEQVSHWEVM